MKYHVEVRRYDKDWISWYKDQSLQEALDEMFRLQSSGEFYQIRMTWTRDESS